MSGYSWMKCCFPSKKEDVETKDNQVVDIINDNLPDVVKSKKNNNQSDSAGNISTTKDQNAKSISANTTQGTSNNNLDISCGKQKSNNNNNNETAAVSGESFIDNINTNRIITDEEIATTKVIKLEEIEGNLFNNKTTTINAAGLIGGRNVKDGVAIFGKSNLENFKCDYELNYDGLEEYPYIFIVYYQRETKSYLLRAYSGKNITNRLLFIRLTVKYEMPIKQKEIVSVGNFLFQLLPVKDDCIEIVNIQKNESEQQSKIFDKKNKSTFIIGRDQKCDLAFPKEKSFSRIQFTIEYNTSNKEWVIYDGTKDKQSTNGTWIFGLHSFPVMDQMIIEVLSSKLKFSFQ